MSTDPASPASPSASPCLRADPDHGPCQEVCEEAQGQIAGGLAVEHGAQIMHWEEGGWKPYRGPRNPELHERILDTIREKEVARIMQIFIIVDSGACDHAMPKHIIKTAPIVRGLAAEQDVAHVAADGGRIPDLGD